MQTLATVVPVRSTRPAAVARRYAMLLALPLIAACAHNAQVASAPAPSADEQRIAQTDRVIWLRLPSEDPKSTVVFHGAEVKVLSGARAQRGDTLLATPPFPVAVELPDAQFELQIAAQPSRSGVKSALHVAYTTVGTNGQLMSVQATGYTIVLRRAGAGEPLQIVGSTRHVETDNVRVSGE